MSKFIVCALTAAGAAFFLYAAHRERKSKEVYDELLNRIRYKTKA